MVPDTLDDALMAQGWLQHAKNERDAKPHDEKMYYVATKKSHSLIILESNSIYAKLISKLKFFPV